MRIPHHRRNDAGQAFPPRDREVRFLCLSALLVAFACATSGKVPPPAPPAAKNSGPTIGQPLRFDLTANGEPLSLRAVAGKITLICVLGPSDTPTARACRDAQLRWGDRIAVVGLATSPDLDPATVPFRVYLDPDGAELKARLDLGPDSKVIVGDSRGRVARVFEPADLPELEQALHALVG